MLFQMAAGDFTYRIIQTDEQDSLSKSEKRLNEFAEKFPISIIESGYILPNYIYRTFVQTTFVLDQDGNICDASVLAP